MIIIYHSLRSIRFLFRPLINLVHSACFKLDKIELYAGAVISAEAGDPIQAPSVWTGSFISVIICEWQRESHEL